MSPQINLFLDGQAGSSDHEIETEVQQSNREDTHSNREAVRGSIGAVPNIVGHQDEKGLPLLVR